MSDADLIMKRIPILFIVGPSGVGKSTLAGWVASDLGFVHLEIDTKIGNGIDGEGLRAEFDRFWVGDTGPFSSVLRARAQRQGGPGIVLSFPSGIVFSAQQCAAAARAGIAILVLYGPKECCLQAFLERERRSGCGLGVDHWQQNNEPQYPAFCAPELAAFRVSAFEDGQFRPRPSLVAEVKRLINGQMQ